MEELQNSMEMYQQILRLRSYTKVTKLTIPNSLTKKSKKGIRQQHKQTVRQKRKQWEKNGPEDGLLFSASEPSEGSPHLNATGHVLR